MVQFFNAERQRSSTELLTNVIEEWDNVFSKDVNLVLLKAFVGIVNALDSGRKSDEYFIESICPYVEAIDFNHVLKVSIKAHVQAKSSINSSYPFHPRLLPGKQSGFKNISG